MCEDSRDSDLLVFFSFGAFLRCSRQSNNETNRMEMSLRLQSLHIIVISLCAMKSQQMSYSKNTTTSRILLMSISRASLQ